MIRIIRETLETSCTRALHPPAKIVRVGLNLGVPTIWVETDMDDPTNIIKQFIILKDYDSIPEGCVHIGSYEKPGDGVIEARHIYEVIQ